MVSAKLLAEIDIRLRKMVRAKHTLRGDAQGFARAFGGINIFSPGISGSWILLPVSFSRKYPCNTCSELRSSIRSLRSRAGRPSFGAEAKDPCGELQN
jgi:hypothetical protein